MISIELEGREVARVNRVLSKIPENLQFAAYDKALRPAAVVVAKRAEQLAPRSSVSGSRNRMSQKSRDIWSEIPLAKLFVVKVIKGRKAAKYNVDPLAIVGPRYPEGNKANFVHPMKTNTKRVVLWGKASRVAPMRRENDFLKRASDETRAQQFRKFTKALIAEFRRLTERSVKSG